MVTSNWIGQRFSRLPTLTPSLNAVSRTQQHPILRAFSLRLSRPRKKAYSAVPSAQLIWVNEDVRLTCKLKRGQISSSMKDQECSTACSASPSHFA